VSLVVEIILGLARFIFVLGLDLHVLVKDGSIFVSTWLRSTVPFVFELLWKQRD
jgi:hypothetical protein